MFIRQKMEMSLPPFEVLITRAFSRELRFFFYYYFFFDYNTPIALPRRCNFYTTSTIMYKLYLYILIPTIRDHDMACLVTVNVYIVFGFFILLFMLKTNNILHN